MFIWFVRRMFIVVVWLEFGDTKIKINLGRYRQALFDKNADLLGLLKIRGRLDWRRTGLASWRMCLSRSRGCPANWRGRLWAVCKGLTIVGGHSSSVDGDLSAVGVGLTIVAAGLAKVTTASPIVETAQTVVGTPRTAVDFAPAIARIAPAWSRFSLKQIFDKGFTPFPSHACAAMIAAFATVPCAVNMISPTRHYDRCA
jgi:hypothetical protein